jgi:hypothetical protein
LLNACHQVKRPYYSSVKDSQICDEFPIFLSQNCVRTNYIDEGGGGWNRVHQFNELATLQDFSTE